MLWHNFNPRKQSGLLLLSWDRLGKWLPTVSFRRHRSTAKGLFVFFTQFVQGYTHFKFLMPYILLLCPCSICSLNFSRAWEPLNVELASSGQICRWRWRISLALSPYTPGAKVLKGDFSFHSALKYTQACSWIRQPMNLNCVSVGTFFKAHKNKINAMQQR